VLSRASVRPLSTSTTVFLARPLTTARYVKLQPRDCRSRLMRIPKRTCRDFEVDRFIHTDCLVRAINAIPLLWYAYRYSGTLRDGWYV